MSKNPPIRPGLIIRDELATGSKGISEMHRTYKHKLEMLNSTRARANRIRGCSYWSFATLCRFARELGLIEEVGEGPIDSRYSNELLTIRDRKVVPARRIIYRLTVEGESEEAAWLNLSGAVRERLGWG
jgi:hypothetical protein